MMKEFFLLKFLDRFQKIFTRSGVDYPVMRRILQMKLTMDERRVPTIMSRNRNMDGKSSYKSALMLYAFMGLFVGFYLFLNCPVYFKMNLVIGLILFMIMMTMVSDFSSVLLDVKDKNILLTRPVPPKTLSAAKMIHVVYYLMSITVSIAGGALVIGLIRYGVWFFLLFLVELILICGFVILLTSILYYAILHFFSGEKLKDIINYFQIALSIVMILMYQLMGRVFNLSGLTAGVVPRWWNMFLPSAWFAAPFSLVEEHNFSFLYILLSIAAVVFPLVALLVYIKAAAPAFERSLQKLNSSGGFRKEMKTGGLRNTAAKLLCRDQTERVFFHFSARMMSNERKFKLKLYPSLAFAVIMPFLLLLSFAGVSGSFADFYKNLSQGNSYVALYTSAAFLCPAILMMSMSENYKAAWIYRAMPVQSPVAAVRGALKAYLYKFATPVYLIVGLIFTVICGPRILPGLILIVLNMLILLLVIFMASPKALPFYKNFDAMQSGGSTAVAFVSLMLCGLLAAVHYAVLLFFAPGIYLLIGVSLLTVILLWHFAFQFSWHDIAEM